MKTYLLASLLLATATTIFAEDEVHCFKADPHRDNVVKECKEQVEKEAHTEEGPKTESMWMCFMRKMEVVKNDELDVPKLRNIIDKWVVDQKQQLLKSAVNECEPSYNGASTDKVVAFYKCYGPKFKKTCPKGL